MNKKIIYASVAVLVLIFLFRGCGNPPEGAKKGEFSVSADKKVYFSQGNLQYSPADDKWRFADNQYDVIGQTNSQISDTYDGWIDLFGWGTAGEPNGEDNIHYKYCYKPTDRTSTPKSYGNGIYGPAGPKSKYDCELTGEYYKYDWGYNKIKNGENKRELWRTLTAEEWEYLLFARPRAMQLLALGDIGGIKGLFIFPDDYKDKDDLLNLGEDGYNSYWDLWNTGFYDKYSDFNIWNSLTLKDWKKLEKKGVVFLPTAGIRYGKGVASVNSKGYYWSSTPQPVNLGFPSCAYFAKTVAFHGAGVLLYKQQERDEGCSVRLVTDVD